jgi:hypothetical protein
MIFLLAGLAVGVALGTAHRSNVRAKSWFAAAMAFALLTIGFAFTVFGDVAEALTVTCLVLPIRALAHRRPIG